MLEGCVSGVRDMALLLRPSMLDDLGLVAALNWQARELTRRTEFDVRMVTEELEDDLPDSHKTCVYRVVQEALNNCAKHSHATQVRVFVRRDSEALSVTVQDDGVGFDSTQERGIGLLGMQERVARLGGLFSIQSSAGRGTILSVRVPLLRLPGGFRVRIAMIRIILADDHAVMRRGSAAGTGTAGGLSGHRRSGRRPRGGEISRIPQA